MTKEELLSKTQDSIDKQEAKLKSLKLDVQVFKFFA